MNKTIRNLAIAALFIFPGLSGFPQEVQQDETPAAKPVVEENVAFPFRGGRILGLSFFGGKCYNMGVFALGELYT